MLLEGTLLTGSALGIFIVYLGRTLFELSKKKGVGIDRAVCSESVERLLVQQTKILESLSSAVNHTNTRIAILMDRRWRPGNGDP